MVLRTIPRSEWASFFEALSMRHEGWLVTIERILGEAPTDLEMSEHALTAVDVELDRGERQIIIACEDVERVAIPDPVRVSIAENGEEQDALLEIEDLAGTYRVHLRFPRVTGAVAHGEVSGLSSEESGLPDEESELPPEELRQS